MVTNGPQDTKQHFCKQSRLHSRARAGGQDVRQAGLTLLWVVKLGVWHNDGVEPHPPAARVLQVDQLLQAGGQEQGNRGDGMPAIRGGQQGQAGWEERRSQAAQPNATSPPPACQQRCPLKSTTKQ